MITIEASAVIQQKVEGLKLGLVLADGLQVSTDDPLFEREFEKLKAFLERKFASARPAEDEVVSHVRRMYRRIGWEPTRYRPSSEALVRRILQGKGLYRINNLVDHGNLVSARFHLPLGLYDMDKVHGTVQVDVGREGEFYEGISKAGITATGKMILRDARGIFGNPTADSRRTSITASTRRALAVFFIPPEVDENYARQTLEALTAAYEPIAESIQMELKQIESSQIS